MTSEGEPPGGGDGTGARLVGRPGFDTSVAHQARMYDYWLGGKDNFAADRKAAEEALAAYPGMARLARENRAFLRRAVRYLAGEAGLVELRHWRPTIETGRVTPGWCGLGRKP